MFLKIVERIGSSQCLLMGSDYPHPEGVAHPRSFADEALDGLGESDIKAIMYENGRSLIPA